MTCASRRVSRLRALERAQLSGPSELDELTLARARPRLLGRAGKRALVEDLAQETFLRALQALPSFRPDGPARLSTWLLTIAARVGLDALEAKRLALEPLERARDVAGGGSADELADRRDVGRDIARAVDALAVEYRATFLLREAHGHQASRLELSASEREAIDEIFSSQNAAFLKALASIYLSVTGDAAGVNQLDVPR